MSKIDDPNIHMKDLKLDKNGNVINNNGTIIDIL